MKRILFCIQDFKQGGIPRCLQSLLSHVDTTSYQIDLYGLRHEGDYLESMPNCNLLSADYVVNNLMLFTTKITRSNFFVCLPSIFLKVLRNIIFKLVGKDILLIRLASIGRKMSSKHYDMVISYAEGYPAVLVENIDAPKKIVWIHNNYAFEGARQGCSITNFDAFSVVCCVSKASKSAFDNYYPQYSHKSRVIYNLTNITLIKQMAKEPITDERFVTDGFFTIVSIGRVCAVKNFAIIPSIVNNMLDSDKSRLKWFIIGDGPEDEKEVVRTQIKKEHLEDTVILLGNKINPYSYLAKANLFVLTSVYESYPTVINEAKALDIPILANDIQSAHEMLDGDNAIISRVEDMSQVISVLINQVDKYNTMKLQHCNFVQSNSDLMEEFYALLD